MCKYIYIRDMYNLHAINLRYEISADHLKCKFPTDIYRIPPTKHQRKYGWRSRVTVSFN